MGKKDLLSAFKVDFDFRFVFFSSILNLYCIGMYVESICFVLTFKFKNSLFSCAKTVQMHV